MRSWCWSVSFWISVAAKVQACSTSTQVTACVAGGFVVERCKWAVRIMGQHSSCFWLWCSFLWLCCLFYIPLWQNYQLRWLLKWYWQIFIFHCCSTPCLWKGAAWYFPFKLITNRWELGCWCLQSWGARQCSSTRKEVSTATLRVAPPRHGHTELFSGILPNQYLPGPELKRVGG